MPTDIAIAVFAGLGGMFGWGLADFFAKKGIDRLGDQTTLFWSQLIGVAPLLVLFLVHPNVPELQRFDVLFLVLFGAVSALSYLPVYSGFGKGQVSLLSPVFASYAAVVVLLSALLFHEDIPIGKGVAILVVFVGVLLISTDPRDLGQILRRKDVDKIKGLPEILIAMVVYSFWLVLLDNFIGDRDWVFFLLVIRSCAALTLVAYSRVTSQGLKVPAEARSLWPILILIGLCDVAAFSFVSYGFSRTEHTSIVAVLSSTFSLPTIVLARTFLGERINRVQVGAACIILTGIALVVL